MTKKIRHCAKCDMLPYCATNDMTLYEEYNPCCPNMKEGRKQFRQFLIDEGYIKE